MASLYYQQEAAALYYAVLGKSLSESDFDYFASRIESNTLTGEQFVALLLASPEAQARYAGNSDSVIVQKVYQLIHGDLPTDSELNGLLGAGSLSKALSNAVTELLSYKGFDSTVLAEQNTFETTVEKILYPSTNAAASGQGASDVLAIYHVLLGSVPGAGGVNYWGAVLNKGTQSFEQVAQLFINSRSYITALNDTDFVTRLFKFGLERSPSSAELSQYVTELSGGTSRGDVVVEIINAIRANTSLTDATAKQHFTDATTSYAQGELPALEYQEQVAAMYLAIPERGIDAGGLDAWSKYLDKNVHTYKDLISMTLGSEEFLRKGAQLTGDNFTQHVYKAVHGVDATVAQLAIYSALGTDKAAITQAIINDLRGSVATDAATVTQQHGFESDIGTSLLYKTAASLTANAVGGNATGTVNTSASHVLSNAETAVLTDVQLNTNVASVVNLKFADHLANLAINGTSAATVNLSDNGVNAGVDVTVNNGNVILNAGSGADNVLLTSTAAIATATGDFNLGAGNDTMKWAGNAAAGSANSVSKALEADGGAGSDILSANFITKDVNISGSGKLLDQYKATISTNASQFTSFEKIDLAGYIGKASVNSGSTATAHTFDFGVLTGDASTESSNDVRSITQPDATIDRKGLIPGLINKLLGGGSQENHAPTGSQGFVLSGLAEGVKVINAAGGSTAQLEVTGDATAASSLDFTFQQNATDKFDIVFNANSDTDVNAGSVGLNSSNSLFFDTKLNTVNVTSGGNGNFGNILSLTGGDNDVTKINVTGEHHLTLSVGSNYSNVTVDASGNTSGVNIDAQGSGTGNNTLVHLLAEGVSILPLAGLIAKPVEALIDGLLDALGWKESTTVSITGTQGDDIFSVKDNTVVQGGEGRDVFNIVSSKSETSVTIVGFDYAKDTLVDQTSGLAFSDHESGIKVANYGAKTSNNEFWTSLVKTGIGTGLEALANILGQAIGLDNNKLSDEVGISSVGDKHFLTIDQNNNRELDSNDTVVLLQGGSSHADLTNNLYYSPVELNGINLAQFQHEQVA